MASASTWPMCIGESCCRKFNAMENISPSERSATIEPCHLRNRLAPPSSGVSPSKASEDQERGKAGGEVVGAAVLASAMGDLLRQHIRTHIEHALFVEYSRMHPQFQPPIRFFQRFQEMEAVRLIPRLQFPGSPEMRHRRIQRPAPSERLG